MHTAKFTVKIYNFLRWVKNTMEEGILGLADLGLLPLLDVGLVDLKVDTLHLVRRLDLNSSQEGLKEVEH